jgi:hypothetical protein
VQKLCQASPRRQIIVSDRMKLKASVRVVADPTQQPQIGHVAAGTIDVIHLVPWSSTEHAQAAVMGHNSRPDSSRYTPRCRVVATGKGVG